MNRLFRARVLFFISFLIGLSITAPPSCFSFPEARVVGDEQKGDNVTFSGDADRTTEAEVYIHIRSDRQQETANRIREKLTQDGYLVPRIIMVSFGPHENQVRYFHNDRARAASIAHKLRTIGLIPISVQQIGHYESNPPGRYEVWLDPYVR